jgi:hypothetical protein
MTVFIEWSTVYRMYQVSIMLGSQVSNFYLPLHEMGSMKFLFKQLTIRSLQLGSTITNEQNDALREALK